MLLVHNRYQRAGGEDRVFDAEGRHLESHGHAVERLVVSNDAVDAMPRARLAATTLWSAEGRAAVEAAARAHRADVVHFHNTLPLISPAGYYGARAAGAAVVQTLHNYRLLCPSATLYRDGAICEDCAGKRFAWPGVIHGCYRGSRAATLAVATMVSAHQLAGTWTRTVDRYIAITHQARGLLVANGLPEDRVAVKYNLLESDPGVGAHDRDEVVFVGRLIEEKGIRTLLRAWERHPDLPDLVVIGAGPDESIVEAAVAATAGRPRGRVVWTGWLDAEAIYAHLRRAAAFVFPSEWYEGGTPIALVEAMAAGLPVAAAGIGAAAEVVGARDAGVLFPPGDADALARAVQSVLRTDDIRRDYSQRARDTYEELFESGPNLDRLLAIYHDALITRCAAPR